MQSSSESEVRTPRIFLTKNGACFTSPYLLPKDPIIDTPNKIPAAPHPSPINMDIGQLNPESKEIFRMQLLKACQLKIPEAIENSSNFEEGVQANLSYTESASPVCKAFFTSLGKVAKNVLSEDKVAQLPEVGKNVKLYDTFEDDRNENSNFKEQISDHGHCSSELNYDFVKSEKSRRDLPQITFYIENGIDKFSEEFDDKPQPEKANLREFGNSKNFKKDAESSHCKYSAHNGNDLKYSNGDAFPDFITFPKMKAELVDKLPVLKADILVSRKPVDDDKEKSYCLDLMPGREQSVFCDSITNRDDLSLLLDSNNDWNDSCSYRSRSPCSDKLSTVAQCASDASDISDIGEFEEDYYGSAKDFESSKEIRSRSLGSSKDFGSTKDCRQKKKPSENLVIRRFLRWRRCFKLRKRAESLDESKFPFLANRFDSYKTEFELSV
ncbi:hypothetical protein JTE90_005426 [Oedothorax gibbosus]|uniref:Uncharacterized protein n=1 Tax=Oedothorax gibbosus TaxID=931172 RepID=A0AAV6UQS1_9ARAC|nr:hypothetical protein JTE90_005426 [Oedothorax gibbosus]